MADSLISHSYVFMKLKHDFIIVGRLNSQVEITPVISEISVCGCWQCQFHTHERGRPGNTDYRAVLYRYRNLFRNKCKINDVKGGYPTENDVPGQ